MQNPKISIIIPIYNAQKTIGNILEKLISQNYQNIEIIAVNDGSEDDSWKILKKFSKKDKRIIAIDQKNAGVSTARNVAVKKATGEFITFIDSDDDISNQLIRVLAGHIKDDLEFIMCGMSINNKEMVAPDAFVENRIFTTKYVLKSLLTNSLLYGPYCKLFRRSIIVDNKIQFPEGVRYGEDTIFVLNYLGYANNITTIRQALYTYNFQSSGLAANNVTNIKFRRSRSQALNKYLINGLSLTSLFLYLLLRIRWLLATIKARAKYRVLVKSNHES